MDGNKKITGIVFAGIIAFTITGCMVQPPGYVSLYVDNFTKVNDTIDPGAAPLTMVDTAMTDAVKRTFVIEPEQPVLLRPAEQVSEISSDSVYQYEVEKLPEAFTDSVQPLRSQIIELQKQLALTPDSSLAGEQAEKFQPLDSLQPEVELKQLIQTKNDTISILPNQVIALNKSAGMKADTVDISKELVKQLEGDSTQTDYKTPQLKKANNDTIALLRKQQPEGDSTQPDHITNQLPQAKNDTVAFLRKQLHELQYNGTITTDTIFDFKETVKLPVAESRQTDYRTQQLLRTKDEQIQILQNQLNAMQNAAAITPPPPIPTEEPAQVNPSGIQQHDQSNLQLFQSQNDTIQLLRGQLKSLQLQHQKIDSVYIEKEAKEIQPVKELESEQITPDLFQALNDSIQFLKTRLLSLEERTLPGIDTSSPAKQEERDTLYKAKTEDTTLIVASYERGGIKPLEEDSVLKQIKELCNNKNVTRITLSGYTDSSGSETINKEITNRRLNYLSEMITPWIAKEKIYFQNFGDIFASETIVSEERRIEIEISASEKL